MTALDTFLELSKIPSFAAAQFQSKDALRVTSRFPDFDRKTYRTSIHTYVVTNDKVFSTFSPDTPNIVVSTSSPSGKRLAAFREVAENGSTKRFVEIWTENRLEASVEVTKTHGAFYTDDIFSQISFSPSEDALVYTAEAKTDDDKDADSLDRFNFVPPLGEAYPGKKLPGLYIVKWSTGKTVVKALQLADSSLGPILFTQPAFAKDTQLIAIGYKYTLDHRLLGVKYCPNRLAGVYSLSLPEISVESEGDVLCSLSSWSSDETSCRSPRILRLNDGSSRLVYLANPVGGPHASCSSLQVVDIETRKTVASVGIVEDPQPADFPGIYAISLPPQPFLQIQGKPYLISTTNWRSRTTVVLVSLEDGSVLDLTPDDGAHLSWVALGTDGESQVVCSRSSLKSPSELLLGRATAVKEVQWKTIVEPSLSAELKHRLSALELSIVPIDGHFPVETIVLKDKEAHLPLPCVSVIHGGPHGSCPTGFFASTTALALEGYVISCPNYTGSVGFGDKYIRKLLGYIGSLDVEECVQSVRQLIQTGIAAAGPGQQFLVGGSHGGFILGHLLGQYPDMFSAASIRNPVMHLGDIAGTDIPDWYFEECGIPYTPTTLLTPELYQKLYHMSPISHVDKTRDDVPILLAIGEKDARVVNSQGLAYYHALKGRGKDIRMITLKEDSHPLDSVEALRVVYKATSELFAEKRKH
ncbi:hypothetical protein EIP91_001608 [Steccherinum ochraceum]|uniref:acylaminoacyl-peptidase n=1 Tax=Steccherinum ochraceum TaxID=92696 RepID=A0A4R0RK08_9APHY|nr:hypothetical protein EIP91_001608 [Steccherinum ochraceum]